MEFEWDPAKATANFSKHGVRFNVICPGSVITEQWPLFIEQQPDLIERTTPLYPIGRLGRPDDIAGAALYLNLLFGVVGASSQTELSLLVAQFAVVLPFVGVTVAIIKRSTSGPSPTRTSLSRTPSKSHDFRERSPRWPR